MSIVLRVNEFVNVEDVIRVFKSSGIIRPVNQHERIETMLNNANLVVTAWDNEKLVGIGRALTDFC